MTRILTLAAVLAVAAFTFGAAIGSILPGDNAPTGDDVVITAPVVFNDANDNRMGVIVTEFNLRDMSSDVWDV